MAQYVIKAHGGFYMERPPSWPAKARWTKDIDDAAMFDWWDAYQLPRKVCCPSWLVRVKLSEDLEE